MSATAIDVSALGEIPSEVVGAVVTSINTMDTSRRVAWAKMYAALRRGEEAERDLERAKEDKILLSRFGGFAFGALQRLGLAAIFREYLGGGDDLLSSYFEQGAVNAGREAGAAWKEHHRKAIFRAAREAALNRICRQFGFDGQEDFFDFMTRSVKHDCDQNGCYVTPDYSYHFGGDGSPVWPRNPNYSRKPINFDELHGDIGTVNL